MSLPSKKLGMLVLGFNRPILLDKTLSSLSQFTDLQNLDFFLSLDGHRNLEEKIRVDSCKYIFNEFAQQTTSSFKYFSRRNRGLRDNVVSSISRAFEDKDIDYLIVVEDDCVFGPSTLNFFKWGFHKMSQLDEIGVVSGSYFGTHKSRVGYTAHRFSSWGWGTNRSVWQSFLKDTYSEARISSMGSDIRSLTRRTPLPYQYEYARIIQNLNKLDSWAIPFDMFLRSNGLLTIKPTVNQIQNIGFGEDSTHTGRGSSLSIAAEYLDVSKIHLASRHDSARIEGFEAWSKLGRLTKELLLHS